MTIRATSSDALISTSALSLIAAAVLVVRFKIFDVAPSMLSPTPLTGDPAATEILLGAAKGNAAEFFTR